MRELREGMHGGARREPHMGGSQNGGPKKSPKRINNYASELGLINQSINQSIDFKCHWGTCSIAAKWGHYNYGHNRFFLKVILHN